MSFLQSNPKIYQTQQLDGMARQWMNGDVFKKLAKLQPLGYYWDSTSHRLTKNVPHSFSTNTPWVHGPNSHRVNCGFDHHVAFDHFNIIPPKCLACWKVTCGLPSFHHLMIMMEIQQQLDFPCKCGIELRDYTPTTYGCYFYNVGFDEGRDKYEIVKQIIIDNMPDGKEIAEKLILKRGCTEYEMVKGPSPYWHMTPKEEDLYDLLCAYVDSRVSMHRQYPSVQNYVKQNWMIWAHSHGDFSYMPYNGGKKLFPEYVKYHKGDRELIKYDLQQALQSVRPDFKDIEIPDRMEKSEDTPEMPKYDNEVIGEHDELT
jgi:hypothetical protein